MRSQIPEKPDDAKNQISMLWDAVWNHIPSRLESIEDFMNIRFRFVFAFMALLLALQGIILGVVIFM